MVDNQLIEQQVQSDGFALVPRVLNQDQVETLLRVLDDLNPLLSVRRNGGVRNLHRISPAVEELADSPAVRQLIEPVLGSGALPVRAILFDKIPEANWKVPWHQDVTIAVANRIETEGFGPWSVKAGVTHVQPPTAVLEAMLSVRIHLDPCREENGALRVVAGSHLLGRIPEERAAQTGAGGGAIICEAGPGDALLMRPLLVHASSASKSPSHRRVIHIDYSATNLPGGLEWYV